MQKKIPFILIGVARSGTTSLAKILDQSTNGQCIIEPTPNLNIETRKSMDGLIKDHKILLENTILKRIRENTINNKIIYGEKNVTYGPFINDIFKQILCRFVFIHRDGRDVVQSLINWHNLKSLILIVYFW